MPEMNFHVRWPDGSVEPCYSPSTVIREYFSPGDQMSLAEFRQRSQQALTAASDRVAAKYGFHCSSAADQLRQIQKRLASFTDDSQQITILKME